MALRKAKTALTPRTSILARAVRQYVLFATFIVLTLSIISFIIARGFLEQRVLAQLSSIVAAKEDLVEQALQNDRVRVALLATREELREVIAGKRDDEIMDDLLAHMRLEHIPVLGMAVFTLDGEKIAETKLPLNTLPSLSQGTTLNTIVNEFGWQEHEIFSPIKSLGGESLGILGVRYDSHPLLDTLISVASIGETGEVLLGAEQDGELVLLHHRYQPEGRVLVLGNLEEQYQYGSPLAQAVSGEEDLRRAEDYAGHDVYAAYRSLPSLGWGLVVKMARNEALYGTLRLAIFLGISGIALIVGAGLIAFMLAKRLTQPIVGLSKRMTNLGPGHWSFDKSVHSGDEVEVLEQVVADMAARLKQIYDHLEEEVTKRTEELRDQYAKDRAVLENIQHGVIMTNPEGVIVDANKSASLLLGRTIGELKGTNVQDSVVFGERKKLFEGEYHPVTLALTTKKIQHANTNEHMNIVCKDDTLVPVNYVITPLLEDDKILGAVIVMQDVTEERRVDYIKSEFISLASHQLRTPLSTFQWYLELFATDDGAKDFTMVQNESIKEMERASKRMTNLIETLLHAAKLEGGSISPKIEKLEVAIYLNDIASELRSLAKDSKIPCKINIPQEPLEIMTDPILLHVVLQNLFSNAVKYTKEGGEVSISLKKNKDTVDIVVEDSGIGIPKDEQPRIFERLFRARNVQIVDTDGSGLGLYISKMVAENMGGKLSFESEEGKGTKFVLSLPMGNSDEGEKRESVI
ncbi:PAS domain-containing protein [Patescibacteria group bacterium]|nr:PAS domain-containing protein [Patescibacteria group bacterium]